MSKYILHASKVCQLCLSHSSSVSKRLNVLVGLIWLRNAVKGSIFCDNFCLSVTLMSHSVTPKRFQSVAPEAFQKWGHFFYCASPTFSWCLPWQGKVQGTVTRTELGQSWPTVRGQSDLWLFSHAVSKVTYPVDRAWSLGGFLYRSSVDTNYVSCSVSEILHLNP